MDSSLHILPPQALQGEAPQKFPNPFGNQPHPWACTAANIVKSEVLNYMQKHPDSELHQLGKMFGVLVVKCQNGSIGYLQAFSAQLDGTYLLQGWVPPIYDINAPNGYFKQEEANITALNNKVKECSNPSEIDALKAERKQRSQALQRWMFSQFHMLNASGEEKDLITLFSNEKPILSAEDYFSGKVRTTMESLPPSGAGECCAPKLLQTAYKQGYTPLCMAEWWMGASPKNELRSEGYYYGACSSKCRPILRHMLRGVEVEEEKQISNKVLASTTQIIYNDEDIVVVNKPSGLLTVPSKEDGYSLQEYLQTYFGNEHIKPVHRLDQDTSGIVVASKTEEAFVVLQKQFQRRDIHKRYEAILQALHSIPTEGVINLPLLPNPYDRPRQMVNYEHGKVAETRYKIREQQNGEAVVDLYPTTGRTHQLRVHMAHPDGLNSPIKGDRLYGQAADRLYLHAAEITFTHPTSKKDLHFCIPPAW